MKSRKNNKRYRGYKSKSFYMSSKIIRRLVVTLYLAIYSTYYLDINCIKPWLRLNDNTLRVMVIFSAYILSGYITTKNIKSNKYIKLIYTLNALLFMLIMCI